MHLSWRVSKIIRILNSYLDTGNTLVIIGSVKYLPPESLNKPNPIASNQPGNATYVTLTKCMFYDSPRETMISSNQLVCLDLQLRFLSSMLLNLYYAILKYTPDFADSKL